MKRLGVLVVLAACPGGTAVIDAPVGGGDSSFGPPPCPINPGRTYTMYEYGFHPENAGGFDIDGDGDIDNALGFLAPVGNQVINDAIQSGFSRYLFDVEGWDNAPADDPDLKMVSYAGVDVDQPPNLTNDFTGAGEFNVTDRDFDINCTPLNVSTSGRSTNRVLYLEADRWGLFVRNIGVMTFVRVQVELTVSADLSTAEGQLGAVMTNCGMSRAYLPQLGSGTFLDLVLADDRQPDIDVDMDGLETITYVAGQVASCRDGDGTLITGPQCMCDPRIADGYSIAVFAHGVPCKIRDVVETE